MVTGAGTSGDPYILSSLSDLEQISVLGLNKYYRLGSDIDASATADPSYNDGEGWLPLGTFTGNFNSNGHKITGLYINRPETDNVGFFSVLNANLAGFILEDVDITGKDWVGGITGYKSNGTNITTSTVKGNITGHDYVGGIIGGTYSAVQIMKFISCDFEGNIAGNSFVGGIIGIQQSLAGASETKYLTVKGTITATGSNIGGICGKTASGTVSNIELTELIISVSPTSDYVGGAIGLKSKGDSVSNVKVDINISGRDYIGGIIGGTALESQNFTLTNSCYNGNLEGRNYVGGIIGIFQLKGVLISLSYTYGSITATGNYSGGIAGYSRVAETNCYSFMTVTGNQHTGGLIGRQESGLITNSYSIGRVTGTTDTGGLVGSKNTGTATDSYWNMNKSTQGTSALGTGKTQSEMKDADTYSTWDTLAVWQVHPMIQGGYPFLRGNHHVDVDGFQDDTIGPPLIVYIDKIKVDDGTTVGGYDDDTYRNKLKAQNTLIVVSGVKKSLAAILECLPSEITIETVASKTVVVTVPVGHDLDEITDYLDGLFLAGVGYTVESES